MNQVKRPINVSLDDDPVRQARVYTRHLVEDAALDLIVDCMNAFHRDHGLLSDEFSIL